MTIGSVGSRLGTALQAGGRRLFEAQHGVVAKARRAITGRPSLLLADEPTGNLDSKAGEALIQMFGELPAAGATACLATRDWRFGDTHGKS